MKRYCLLAIATVLLGSFAFWAFKLGLGWKSLSPKREGPLIRDPIVWTKFTTINSLSIVGRQRPFTQKEMSLLRQSISDPNKYIRVEAIAALREAKHDPRQREEAIRLILPCLKDPEWIVRAYAVRSMFWLEAKETIPHILPLLNDPKPEVREAAKRDPQKVRLPDEVVAWCVMRE